ncbi:MAG: gliding motility-associated ABC transporter ATP-binding subunit GldA, partial [Flavobacteriales bacterium]|nr:gliding motility-associated ABC transporter ATP-binding subunit GldA [Flavobacteriales bacterium]
RVGLAQAMIHDPKVLILDEPTTGLDPNQLEEIRALIKNIGKEKTIMLSTHIMQEVEAICDKTIIINHGKIVANESTKNLKSNSSKNIVLTVEFDKTVALKEIQAIDGVLQVKKKPDAEIWLIEITSDAVRNHIFQFAMNKEVVVLSLQKENESLESIFKKLTTN